MKTIGRFVLSVLILAMLGTISHEHLNAAPGTGTLFGTDALLGNLLIINPATGTAQLVGSTGAGSVPSLAVDPLTGIMYAGGGGGFPDIYTVNPGTGAATLLGGTGLGFAAVAALDFNAAGTLYAAINIAGAGGTGADHLAIINKATGAATVVGPFGACTGVTIPSAGEGSCTIEGIEGIAFDAAGTLWGSHRTDTTGAPGLYRINPATGAATFAAPIVDASGFPPIHGVVSLQFACDGTLYGGTAFPDGNLIIINPATGVFSTVGNTVPDGSLGALAFQSACAPPQKIPAVSGGATVALVVLFAGSLMWMVSRRQRGVDQVG